MLNSTTLTGLPAPVRPRAAELAARPGIVHIGLGAFARAHVFEFTAGALEPGGDRSDQDGGRGGGWDGDRTGDEGGDWGVLAVAPRSANTVTALRRQDLLSSVLVRGADPAGDRIRVNGLLRGAWCAAREPAAVIAAIADPAVRVITLSITEAGYRIDPVTGAPRTDDVDLAADLHQLSRRADADTPWRTAPGLLLAGLSARHRAGAGPVALVSCDNLVGNGGVLAAAVRGSARRLAGGGDLCAWLESSVDFPDTVVDRITPATTAADLDRAEALLGVRDEAVVVCEPYRQWVIADRFPAGRPAWERAGALMVDDVAPYAAAKLRLLNAGHTMLAHLGLLLGRDTVAAAMRDTALVEVSTRFLRDEAVPALAPAVARTSPPLDLAGYVDAALRRFAHPRMAHRLDQIAVDGTQKLAQRIVPTVRAVGPGSLGLLAVAGWGVLTRRRVRAGLAPRDPRAAALAAAATGPDPAAGLLALIAPDLADDAAMRSALAHGLAGLDRDPAGCLRER